MDNFTPEIELQISRYLDNSMSADEKQLFQQHIHQNPSLQNYIDSLQLTTQAIRMAGLKTNLQAIHTEMMQQKANQAPVYSLKNKRTIIRSLVAVAASVLFCIIGYQAYLYYNPSASNLYNEQYKSFELSEPRSVGLSSASAIEQAYRKKEFKQVAALATMDVQQSVTDDFLSGMAHMELQQANKAIAFFTRAQQNNAKLVKPLYKDDISYYLALAYLKNKNYQQASGLMEQISKEANNIYQANFSDGYINKIKRLHK